MAPAQTGILFPQNSPRAVLLRVGLVALAVFLVVALEFIIYKLCKAPKQQVLPTRPNVLTHVPRPAENLGSMLEDETLEYCLLVRYCNNKSLLTITKPSCNTEEGSNICANAMAQLQGVLNQCHLTPAPYPYDIALPACMQFVGTQGGPNNILFVEDQMFVLQSGSGLTAAQADVLTEALIAGGATRVAHAELESFGFAKDALGECNRDGFQMLNSCGSLVNTLDLTLVANHIQNNMSRMTAAPGALFDVQGVDDKRPAPDKTVAVQHGTLAV